MAKARKPAVALADRRGLFPEAVCANSWFMTLVQVPGRAGPVDLDELVDRLTERGVIGAAKRNVGPEVHAGRVPTPAGMWGLLVALPGQSWAYLLPSDPSYDLPATIAQQTGLRTIGAGYQDTANASAFDCFEGAETLARFQTCGMSDAIVEHFSDDPEEAMEQTLFTGSRLPGDWIRQFRRDWDALDALAKEFDAFIPLIVAGGLNGAVKMQGFDRKDLRPADYLRIDLVGFGNARLEPSAADHQLLAAIQAGDAEAVRAAVAAGADLNRLPGQSASPLNLALKLRRGGAPRREVVAALLKLGTDVRAPGQEPPVHVVLEPIVADEAELIDRLELLTARGADVNARGLEGLTQALSPLHKAAMRGWLAVAKFLVAKGADVHEVNALGRTPRQEAEAALHSLGKLADAESHAKYGAVMAFLADAESGGAT